MLRPVPEVVGSKQKYYAGPTGAASKLGEVSRTAAWVNIMLHTERSTRGEAGEHGGPGGPGGQRTFVRYADMLTDWTVPVFAIGQRFGLEAVQKASANDIRAVHAFIDPDLRRVLDELWPTLTPPTPPPSRPTRTAPTMCKRSPARR